MRLPIEIASTGEIFHMRFENRYGKTFFSFSLWLTELDFLYRCVRFGNILWLNLSYSVEQLKFELSLLHPIPPQEQILLYGPPYKALDNQVCIVLYTSFELCLTCYRNCKFSVNHYLVPCKYEFREQTNISLWSSNDHGWELSVPKDFCFSRWYAQFRSSTRYILYSIFHLSSNEVFILPNSLLYSANLFDQNNSHKSALIPPGLVELEKFYRIQIHR